jgi:hypothetical protein
VFDGPACEAGRQTRPDRTTTPSRRHRAYRARAGIESSRCPASPRRTRDRQPPFDVAQSGLSRRGFSPACRASAGSRPDGPWAARVVNASSSECDVREHVASGFPRDSQPSFGHHSLPSGNAESAAPCARRFQTRLPSAVCAREVQGTAGRDPADARCRAAESRRGRLAPFDFQLAPSRRPQKADGNDTIITPATFAKGSRISIDGPGTRHRAPGTESEAVTQ